MALDCVIASEQVPDYEKSRPELHKRQINMNQPGSTAADFQFTLAYGGKKTMHSIVAGHLLILFYNPDCSDCVATRNAIQSSPLLLRLQKESRLKVLAIYPDHDIELWRKNRENIPDGWINGYCPKVGDKTDPIYDLRAIPTLYLLDSEKRVVLKDAPMPQVEAELMTLLPKTN